MKRIYCEGGPAFLLAGTDGKSARGQPKKIDDVTSRCLFARTDITSCEEKKFSQKDKE